jgi:predicted transcriptional regulator of viral defense system
MRNDNKRSKTIIKLAGKLPVFTFNDFLSTEESKSYLWMVLHRYEKSGKLLRLKKGIYTTTAYVERMKNRGEIEVFTDFIANFLYSPSYLSLETILYRYNILTEIPVNLTSVSKSKTAVFTNKLGNFIYHKVKPSLFCGFDLSEESSFSVMRATKAKALFDFLYLRKNVLPSREAVKELRLNARNLNRSDINELKKYVALEGTKKLKEILNYLLD